MRIDLHIVRTSRGWLLQNANAKTLATFGRVEVAIEHGEATARQLRMRGLGVRLTIHPPGKRSQVLDYPAMTLVEFAGMESYALTRCGLS